MEGSQTLEELREGALFITKDGTLAVKSQYRMSNNQCECILLSSGSYAHFERRNSEPVIEVDLHTDHAIELASVKARLEFLKSKGITVGVLKEAGKEPKYAYVVEPGSELCDLKTLQKLVDTEVALNLARKHRFETAEEWRIYSDQLKQMMDRLAEVNQALFMAVLQSDAPKKEPHIKEALTPAVDVWRLYKNFSENPPNIELNPLTKKIEELEKQLAEVTKDRDAARSELAGGQIQD